MQVIICTVPEINAEERMLHSSYIVAASKIKCNYHEDILKVNRMYNLIASTKYFL